MIDAHAGGLGLFAMITSGSTSVALGQQFSEGTFIAFISLFCC